MNAMARAARPGRVASRWPRRAHAPFVPCFRRFAAFGGARAVTACVAPDAFDAAKSDAVAARLTPAGCAHAWRRRYDLYFAFRM
ncbi:hypothetical protein WCQ02_05885 [Paraburkholderia tropica]|uniref:hypothetical protein n=1 Tax=Paraburkholderia tropica TaxID=92647 RepID=UPI000F52D305|nr:MULTISPECIES: hypothetical protein [Paraburkholderia]RQM49688.1 hypothetical protein EHZ19_04630 [Paraburkholderia bannensis]